MEKGLMEEMLFDLTNEIGNHAGLQKLGIKLKFTSLEMIEFDKVNKKNPFEGTVRMLSQWRKDTETTKQIPQLKTALTGAGLKGVARSFFKVCDKEAEKQRAKLRKASGNEKEAGTSTAIADKPKTESTPAKKPAQKDSKTTETKVTKPTSGASTSKKSTCAGGNRKSANGINAGKEPAKKRKTPEGNNTPNKKTNTTTSTTTVKVEASGSATISNIKVTGQEIKKKGKAKK